MYVDLNPAGNRVRLISDEHEIVLATGVLRSDVALALARELLHRPPTELRQAGRVLEAVDTTTSPRQVEGKT